MDLSQRLTSLDILRGLTIAGMVVVNDPGSWSSVYPPLLHASWSGITPTDFVYPFFLFIVGVSIVLAYTKRLKTNVAHGPLIKKIVIRSAIIFGLGLLLWLFPKFNFSGIRIPGVLQRIALVFMACAILFLKSNWRSQAIIGGALLLGYWLLLALIPVPIDEVIREALASGEIERSGKQMISVAGLTKISEGFVAANYLPGVNITAWLDRLLVPGRFWEVTWDPEGLMSTLPAIATGITGMMAGHLLLSENKKEQKVIYLFVMGFLMMALGNVWDWFFPFNKNLWSSSFVMYTSGLASMTLAAVYWWVDVKKKGENNWLFFVGRVFGANAITAYVLHSLIARFMKPIQEAWMSGLTGIGLEAKFVSFLYALSYTGLIYLLVWIMYKRKVFLKI